MVARIYLVVHNRELTARLPLSIIAVSRPPFPFRCDRPGFISAPSQHLSHRNLEVQTYLTLIS
jgi:hypothetical protein